MTNLCVHGKPLYRPELCRPCWQLAWALGLVETREPPKATRQTVTAEQRSEG